MLLEVIQKLSHRIFTTLIYSRYLAIGINTKKICFSLKLRKWLMVSNLWTVLDIVLCSIWFNILIGNCLSGMRILVYFIDMKYMVPYQVLREWFDSNRMIHISIAGLIKLNKKSAMSLISCLISINSLVLSLNCIFQRDQRSILELLICGTELKLNSRRV